MTIKIRPYRGSKEVHEYDIKIRLPSGEEVRERKKSPVSGKESTKRWAAARERELYDQALSGKLKAKAVPTMREFWSRYMSGHLRASALAPATITARDSHYRTWLDPHLGEKTLDAISSEEIGNLVAAMLETSNPNYVRAVLTTLRGILSIAVEWKEIDQAPVFKAPKKVESQRNVFPPSQFPNLVRAAKDCPAETLAMVRLTGEHAMRIGEVLGLGWESINFATRTIKVERAIHKGHLGKPKGGRVREFKLSPLTLEALLALKRKGPFVFCQEDGSPLTARSAQRKIAHAFKAVLGVEIGPHSLRHSATTRMGNEGVPISIIRQVTGHKDLKVLATYLHDDVEATQLAVEKMEAGEMMEKGSKPSPMGFTRKTRRWVQKAQALAN